MKPFNNYDDAKKQAQSAGFGRLPAGAYVCRIMAVRYDQGQNGYSDSILLSYDIIEGEYKDYFKNQYQNSTFEDKKWKGNVRVYVPKDDGSEQDGWTKKIFASWINAVEKSNTGYSWDWDEDKLKGKALGIVFGDTGTIIDDKEIVYTEPRFGVDAELVRSGKAPAAKFKAKNGYGKGSAANDYGFVDVSEEKEEGLPF